MSIEIHSDPPSKWLGVFYSVRPHVLQTLAQFEKRIEEILEIYLRLLE